MSEARDRIVSFRLTDPEYSALKKRADRARLDVSSLVRREVTGAPSRAPVLRLAGSNTVSPGRSHIFWSDGHYGATYPQPWTA